jgi:hypothetical protein
LLNVSEAEPARDGWGYPKLNNRVRNHKHGIFCVRFQIKLGVLMFSRLFGGAATGKISGFSATEKNVL